jgi:hypothetical protein
MDGVTCWAEVGGFMLDGSVVLVLAGVGFRAVGVRGLVA